MLYLDMSGPSSVHPDASKVCSSHFDVDLSCSGDNPQRCLASTTKVIW